MTNATSKTTGKGANTDIVLADGTEIVVRKADGNEVAKFLTGAMISERAEETSEEIAQRMVSQVFAAETAEEILSAGAATHVRDVLDQPFRLVDVDWQVSAFKEEKDAEGNAVGLPVFAVIKAVDTNGAPVTLTTGAFMPCAQVYRMQQQGVLSDIPVKFVKRDRPTKRGFYPINMVAA